MLENKDRRSRRTFDVSSAYISRNNSQGCQRSPPIHSFFILALLSSPADLAAIPDFQSGAMENWGLTTYRETGLLYDPDRSSASDRMSIVKVIAHELAHQVASGGFVSLCAASSDVLRLWPRLAVPLA